MTVRVQFFSWYKDLAGGAAILESVPDGCTAGELFRRLAGRYPGLAQAERSTLMAVGTDYQPRDYVLKDGDEVSFFPPVQGG